MKELTKELLLKEAGELGADVLLNSSRYDFKSISKNNQYVDINYFEEEMHKTIKKLFKKTKPNEEKILLSTENNNIHFLNENYMLTSMQRSLILTDQSNIYLGSLFFNPEKDIFEISSENFSCSLFKNKSEITYHLKNGDIYSSIKAKKNTLIINSFQTDITSIQFNQKSTLVRFKDKFYSSILFDNDFNIKVIDFSDDLKNNLVIEKDLKFKNVSYSGGLLKNVKILLKANLDFYNLVNDSNYIFENSKITFENELKYIKKIVSKKTDILQFYQKHENSINEIKNYYQDVMYKQNELKNTIGYYIDKKIPSYLWESMGLENLSISDYVVSKESFRQLMLLSFLNLIKQQKKPIIHPELVNIINVMSNDVSEIMSLKEIPKQQIKTNKVK